MGLLKKLQQLGRPTEPAEALAEWLQALYEESAAFTPQLVYETERFWPAAGRPATLQLYAYTEPSGNPAIALGSPLPYTFAGMDFGCLSYEELLLMYAGWHACYNMLLHPHYPLRQQGADREVFRHVLQQAGYQAIRIEEEVLLGTQNFYSARATLASLPDTQAILVGSAQMYQAYAPDAPPMQRPLYYYLGWALDQEE
jgi:hypothetical protein